GVGGDPVDAPGERVDRWVRERRCRDQAVPDAGAPGGQGGEATATAPGPRDGSRRGGVAWVDHRRHLGLEYVAQRQRAGEGRAGRPVAARDDLDRLTAAQQIDRGDVLVARRGGARDRREDALDVIERAVKKKM